MTTVVTVFSPLDQRLQLSDHSWSPATLAQAIQLGTEIASYRRAAQLFADFTHLPLAKSSLQRLVTTYGEKVAAQFESEATAMVQVARKEAVANQYLMNVLGLGYGAANGFLGNGHWYFRVVYQCSKLPQSLEVGKLLVDADTDVVIPLTTTQIEDARDQALEYTGEATGILRPTACRRMQGYLTNHVSLFAVPDRPIYLDGNPPLWRATIFLQLRGHGRVCDLGTLDVNTRTGEVIALSYKQRQIIRDRVQDATTRTTLATATTR